MACFRTGWDPVPPLGAMFFASSILATDRRIDTIFARGPPCRSTWPALCGSQSKPLTPSSTALVYTTLVYTAILGIQQDKDRRGGAGPTRTGESARRLRCEGRSAI